MLGFLFSPNGRISRSDIWFKFFFPYLGLSIVATIVDRFLPGADTREIGEGPISAILGLAYLWPSIAVSIKRYHDRGMTGWWVLYGALLLIPGLVSVIMGAMGGQVSFEQLDNLSKLGTREAIFILVGAAEILVVGIVLFVIQYVLRGRRGGNRFGPDPLEGRI